jgi:hypothetical protein
VSCQSVIDLALSKAGKRQRTITVLGEKGPAKIPENCAVDFRDCEVGKLEAVDSVVIVCQSTLLEDATITGGQLTLDRVTIKKDVHLSGTKATQKKCTVQGQTFLADGASIEALGNTRSGPGHAGVTLDASSRAVLIEDVFGQGPGYDVAVSLSDHSFLSSRNSSLYGQKKAVLLTSSQAEVYGGLVQGHDDTGIEALQGSTVLVSGQTRSILGTRAAVYCDASKVRLANVQGISGDEVGIICLNDGEVEVVKFSTLKGMGNFAVRAESGGSVTTTSGDQVTSPAADAVHLIGGKFTARRLTTGIVSQGGSAIHSDGGSIVVLDDMQVEIRGYGSNAITAGNGDVYTISRCPLLQGDAGHGVKSGNDCTFTLRSIASVVGLAGRGADLGNDCTLDLSLVGQVLGQAGDGVFGGDDCSVTFGPGTTIRGLAASGISLGANARVRGRGFVLVEGVDGSGVSCGEGSDVELRDFGQILGRQGEGVGAPSSTVVLLGPSKPRGEVHGFLGTGVHVGGKGGSVRVERLAWVAGEETGNGVQVDGGQIWVSDVARVDGPANAVAFHSGSTGTVTRCGAVTGGDGAGVLVDGGGNAQVSKIEKLSGTGKGGVYAEGATLVVSGVALLEGSPCSAKCVSSQVTLLGCPDMQGDLSFEGSSAVLTVNGCTLTQGDVSASDGSGRFTHLAVEIGSLRGSGADLRCEGVDFTAGSVTITKCSFFAVATNLTAGELNAVISGLTCLRSSAMGGQLNASGLLAVACSFGDMALTGGGSMVASGGATSVTGAGSAWLCNAGTIALPVSGGVLTTDSISLQAGQVSVLAQTLMQLTSSVSVEVLTALLQLTSPLIYESTSPIVGGASVPASLATGPGMGSVTSAGDFVVEGGLAGVSFP